jgi:hypothetical protein
VPPLRKKCVGRPKTKSENAVTPEAMETIWRMWCQGISNLKIAKAVGIVENTVRYHVRSTILPLFRRRMQQVQVTEYAKIEHLEKVAWEKFHESTAPTTRKKTKKAMRGDATVLEVVERIRTKIARSGETAWLDLVKRCIERRLKISGGYAAQELILKKDDEYRVAGKLSLDAINETMTEKLIQRMKEIRAYEAAVRRWGGGEN